MKTLVLFILIALSQKSSAQSFRISEDKKVEDVDVFIAPGINPQGDRLLHLTFVQFGNSKNDILTNKVSLLTANGVLLLPNPVKTSRNQGNDVVQNHSSYLLNDTHIKTLKENRITHIKFYMGRKSKKLAVSDMTSNDIYELIRANF